MNWFRNIIDFIKLFFSSFRTHKSLYLLASKLINIQISKIAKDDDALKELLLVRRLATALANAKCNDIITANKIDEDKLKQIEEIREVNVELNNKLNEQIEKIKNINKKEGEKDV